MRPIVSCCCSVDGSGTCAVPRCSGGKTARLRLPINSTVAGAVAGDDDDPIGATVDQVDVVQPRPGAAHAARCRADREIPASVKKKISLMCDVDQEAVVTAADAPSIYDIPKVLHREGLDAYVVRRLNLPFRDVDWTVWDDLLRRVHHPSEEVTIALVGKYIDLPDAYLSVTEALRQGFPTDFTGPTKWNQARWTWANSWRVCRTCCCA